MKTREELLEEIERNNLEIIENLERLKETEDDNSEFCAELQERQAEIIRDLEKLKNEQS